MDLPFHGGSSLTYKNFWHLARELSLRVQKGSLLIGWSMGASLALIMAYLFPDRFRGLVLIGASPCFSCFWHRKNLRAFILRLEKEGEEFLKEFRTMAFPKAFEGKIELSGAKTILKDYMNLDIRSLLPHIRQRVIILHGEKDTIVPVRSAFTLYSMLKRAKLLTFLGGHFPKDESIIFEVLKGF